VKEPAQIEAVFSKVEEQWGSIDVLVHCLAFAGKDELIGDYSTMSPRADSKSHQG
jgi:enoyl-[acyl-carrier protein] reductase I